LLNSVTFTRKSSLWAEIFTWHLAWTGLDW